MGEVERLLQLILEEQKYQTKLLEDVIAKKEDCAGREEKIKELRAQLFSTVSTVFKGTQMEEKMSKMLKGVINGF